MYFLMLCLICFCPLFSQELNLLYQKNYVEPCSAYEDKLIEHVKTSLEKAVKLESKLTGKQFIEMPATKKWRLATIPNSSYRLSNLPNMPYYHLLNNLCNLAGASHLHMGLLAGNSFIAALYGNQSLLKQQIGVDWFQECPEDLFYANCHPYLDCHKCQVIDSECFKFDKTAIQMPIDIYFYDADHSLMAHEKAFTYYNEVFAEAFIVVIDDWECPWIRRPTFKAFDKLGYCILYENTVASRALTSKDQYVAVIRKLN